MAPSLGASRARRRLLDFTIGRTPLLIGAGVLIAVLLGLGYVLQARRPTLDRSLDVAWGGEPLTVAIGVEGMPLSFTRNGEWVGMWPDLFAQAPLAGRSWSLLHTSESDAAAAVVAGAADVALLPLVQGQGAFGLTTSAPLASHTASLFALAPILGAEAMVGHSVAWFGAEGLVPALLRLAAEPVATMSVDDCLTRVLTGTVVACAVDETVGRAHAAALGLGERLLIVGSPLAAIEYVLAWRPTDTQAAQVLPRWLAAASTDGVTPSLQRQWLGLPLLRNTPSRWSGSAGGLAALAAVLGMTAVLLFAQNRRLRSTISQRARALARSAPRHTAAFEATGDAVFVLEPRELGILEANPRAHALSGHAPGRLVGLPFTELLPARQRRLLRRTFLDDEPVELAELPLVHTEGTVATVRLRSFVITGTGGPERVCLVSDITEPVSSRREVARLSDLSRRLIEAVPLPLLVIDGAARVLAANPATVRLGLPSDAAGLPVDEVLRSSGDPLSQQVSAIIGRRDGGVAVTRVLGADDPETALPATLTPLGDDSRPWGALLVVGQSTEGPPRPGQDQRQDVLSALGQVSGVLAHDIRSRVSNASLGVQMLQEGLPPDHPDRLAVQIIREEIDFTMEVVDDILTLLRPGKIQRDTCRVDQILERVVVAQAALSHSSGVEVLASLASGTPAVTGDPVQLERALGNLVKNAIEASPVGGVVRVALVVTPAGTGANTRDELRVTIADQGPGIPPHIRGRLFEPYASGKRGGTGLGLSIVKKIVDEHKGRIEVDSRVNSGTTFSVYLPVNGG